MKTCDYEQVFIFAIPLGIAHGKAEKARRTLRFTMRDIVWKSPEQRLAVPALLHRLVLRPLNAP